MISLRVNGEGTATQRPEVSVIYHAFPHYRAPVMRALANSASYDFIFFGSDEVINGIPAFVGDSAVQVRQLGFRPLGPGGIFSGLIRAALKRSVKCVILIGNPNYLQTWIAAALARLSGKKVLFWSHGWLRHEGRIRSALRNAYFGLANGVLVYGKRAQALGSSSGYPSDRIFPIFNSLDWDRSSEIFAQRERIGAEALRKKYGLPDCPIIICTARLTEACRFDLLISAAQLLRKNDVSLTVLLVGDGPLRPNLEEQAKAGIADIRFLGAIYDEEVLGDLLYIADVTVSPGKVGLTAMHSLTYGTPVISHGDLDNQMPEVEAIVPGTTGDFFERNNAEDLCATIRRVLGWKVDRDQVRTVCRQSIEQNYTPKAQVAYIEAAVECVLGRTCNHDRRDGACREAC